jgi:hypothetical protein
MPGPSTLPRSEIERLDRIYREGGLRAMASPHIHYDEPACPNANCGYSMEWIDFKLELHGDAEGIYKPLVRAWWDGTGFVGRCPKCQGWIHFTTLGMRSCEDQEASQLPNLPSNWASVAQFG